MNPEMYQELVRQVNSLQKQVDALVKPEVGRWLNWTPTVNQGGVVTYNAATSFAQYELKDNLIVVHADLAINSAGAAGNAIVVGGIPYGSARASDFTIGHGIILDSGTQLYTVEVVANTATSWRFFEDAVGGNYFGITPGVTLASGDFIKFTATYKRA